MPDSTETTIETTMPPLYAAWLRAITGGPIPRETLATCDRCVMLPAQPAPPHAIFFTPATKCCTYQPTIPNFLVGRILNDTDPALDEGRASLERRMAQRGRVNPTGVIASRAFVLLYVQTPGAFGRAPALKCPHLTDAGDCGIWRHRPGVCTTWFCKHVRGNTGFRFWELTNKLLRELESGLSLWCAAELQTSASQLAALERDVDDRPEVSDLDGPLDEARYQLRWGQWIGREEAFYRACATLVEPLDWPALQRICGVRVRVLADLVRDAYDHLTSEAIPAALRLGSFRIVDARDHRYWLASYSEFDPLVMTDALFAALPYFDGRPTEDALAALLAERHLHMDVSLVRRMVDFGILVE